MSPQPQELVGDVSDERSRADPDEGDEGIVGEEVELRHWVIFCGGFRHFRARILLEGEE